MNNRIEQLAEQVDLLGDFIPTKIPGRYAGTIDITTIEKFAELIVRECAEVCRLKYAASDVISKECSINFSKDVRKHFGI